MLSEANKTRMTAVRLAGCPALSRELAPGDVT
jgi:hypothetical protein